MELVLSVGLGWGGGECCTWTRSSQVGQMSVESVVSQVTSTSYWRQWPPAQAMRDDLLSTLFARHAGPGNRPCRVRDDTRCLYTILVLACMSGWRKDGHQSVTMLKGIASLPFFPFLFCFLPPCAVISGKKEERTTSKQTSWEGLRSINSFADLVAASQLRASDWASSATPL